MLLKDIPLEYANNMISALADLRPDMITRIVSIDHALFQLGLVSYVPCTLEIEASEDKIRELVDEVYQMEIDAYNYDNQDLKNPERAKQQKKNEDRYERYAIILNLVE